MRPDRLLRLGRDCEYIGGRSGLLQDFWACEQRLGGTCWTRGAGRGERLGLGQITRCPMGWATDDSMRWRAIIIALGVCPVHCYSARLCVSENSKGGSAAQTRAGMAEMGRSEAE